MQITLNYDRILTVNSEYVNIENSKSFKNKNLKFSKM